MFEEEIELQTDTNNKGENLSVMSYKTDIFNTTMTQPDLLVYSASGLNEPNFRVVVPANKGFVPHSRVQVKIIKPKLGGFMFDEGIAGLKDSAVIFADSVEEMK